MNATVGPYTLGDSLGMLPFGELVEATHAARSEPLAVLRLDERLAKDTRFRGLLRLENARAGGLRHPALARVIEIGEAGGAMYLVVERPPICLTLGRGLTTGGMATTEDVMGMVRQLAEGVDAAHARRLVHGAIDPSCVLVGEDGAVKLTGIGILAAAEEAGLVGVVAERHQSDFVAPEQQAGPRNVASADAYALGVLATTLFREHVDAPAPSAAVAAVLERQTSDDPSARYPTCTTFVTALAEASAPAAPIEPAPPTAPSVPLQPVAPTLPATAEPARFTAPPMSPPPSTPTPSPAATTAPADAPRETSPPLPWEPAASVSAPGMAAPPEALRPAGIPPAPRPPGTPPAPPPTPTPSVARPGLPEAGEFEVWVRDLIDPPRPTAPSRPTDLPWDGAAPGHVDTSPLQQHPGPAHQPTSAGASRADTTWAAAEIQPTRAMLAVPGRLEQRDPLGDAVRWATRNAPTIDQFLDRYVTDGKVGPVPLGIAAAAVLALLLILLSQFVFATAVVMLVVVLYGIPRIAGALTAGERKRREQAMRVTGPASLQRQSLGLGWDRHELVLANGVALSLPRGGYERLASYGRPVEVERPAPTGGTMSVVVGHELPSVSVTYLSQRSLLLDVRDANDVVLARHPQYDGEPGDTLAEAPVIPVPAPTWHRTSQSQAVRFPMPPAVRTALDDARKSALVQVILFIGGPLVLILATLNTALTGFLIVGTIGLFATLGAPRLERLLRLRSATTSDTLTWVTGPVTLEQYSTSSSSRYQLRVANGDVVAATLEAYDVLVLLGELRMSAEPPTTKGEEYLTRSYEVESATIVYEPAGPLLLEIRDATGETGYRESALGSVEIAAPHPRT